MLSYSLETSAVPIPDDWNEIDYITLSVTFPDSPKWRGVVLGVLSVLEEPEWFEEASDSDIDQISSEVLKMLIGRTFN